MVANKPVFKSLFAVKLSCDSCVDDISSALSKLEGISSINCSIEKQLCEIEGSAAPSMIVKAIQDTGRDAILRGSGEPNSAAVCILETHAPNIANPIKGLARLVQVAKNLTIVDLSMQNLEEGEYSITIRKRGDISRGAESTGDIWDDDENTSEKVTAGMLGKVKVGKDGNGNVLVDSPVAIWKIIGRAIAVSRSNDTSNKAVDDSSTMVGVIARSAGVWENEKTVCSCSGKTVWEERKEQKDRGMI